MKMIESKIKWIYRPDTWPQSDVVGLADGAAHFRAHRLDSAAASFDLILDTLHAYGQSLAKKQFQRIPGLSFLIFWLQRKNLEQILKLNFGSRLPAFTDRFFVGNAGLKGTGRGIVSHWVAGNVATLAVFSWAMAALTNNRSLVRVSEESLDDAHLLFGALRDLETDEIRLAEGKNKLLSDLAILHFSREQKELHCVMSTIADVRLVWGGSEAIQAIRELPTLDHAEDLIFGPKFSIALMDGEAISDEQCCAKLCRALATDIVAFDQRACSSPQILFVHATSIQEPVVRRLVNNLASEIQLAIDRIGASPSDGHVNMQIFSARAEYAMKETSMLREGDDFQFSLLIDDDLTLSEAVQHRTLYIKIFRRFDEILDLVSPKIQTVGLGLLQTDNKKHWQALLAERGVARCVPLGTMNHFEHPWDGMFPLDRLVRWSRLTT